MDHRRVAQLRNRAEMKRYYTNALDSHVFEHVDGPFVRWEDHQARVKVLEGALLSLLPGLVLDRR